ncbi:hypothetical protein J26TS2_24800 [Shouchella clausii]|nr:hypothetical protein J26TS2_24800 [Shouchella clausii]
MNKNWFKRGLIGACCTSVAVVGLTFTAIASSEPEQEETITADYGIVEGVVADDPNAISTSAESGNKDGGYWIRGKRDGQLVSEYKHYKKEGRASVTNGKGYHKDGGWKKPEKWSKASLKWTFTGTNKAYYDYR